MTSLISLNVRLNRRLDYLTVACKRCKSRRGNLRSIDQFAAQEGLLSMIWQSWAAFVRNSLVLSAQGVTTSAGAMTTSPYHQLQIGQILTLAVYAAKDQSLPAAPKAIRGDHLEPTWGDVQKAQKIVLALSPSNITSLQRGLGIVSQGKDAQSVRNASAHVSRDRFADISKLSLNYSGSFFRHPSDALFWIDPTTGSDAWAVWIDDFRAAAAEMIL